MLSPPLFRGHSQQVKGLRKEPRKQFSQILAPVNNFPFSASPSKHVILRERITIQRLKSTARKYTQEESPSNKTKKYKARYFQKNLRKAGKKIQPQLIG